MTHGVVVFDGEHIWFPPGPVGRQRLQSHSAPQTTCCPAPWRHVVLPFLAVAQCGTFVLLADHPRGALGHTQPVGLATQLPVQALAG